MPTITFSQTDEDIERIASRVADKLANLIAKHQPEPQLKSQQPPPDNRLQVSRTEAARRLGCNTVTLDRLAKRGLIHPNRATRCPMYPVKELERFVRECSQPIDL
jgi:hypothetical protein